MPTHALTIDIESYGHHRGDSSERADEDTVDGEMVFRARNRLDDQLASQEGVTGFTLGQLDLNGKSAR